MFCDMTAEAGIVEQEEEPTARQRHGKQFSAGMN
jgi:hypothetical protein